MSECEANGSGSDNLVYETGDIMQAIGGVVEAVAAGRKDHGERRKREPETRLRDLRHRSLMCSAVIQPSRNTAPTATHPWSRRSTGSHGFGAGPNSVVVGKP
jgi:hypothetical protein